MVWWRSGPEQARKHRTSLSAGYGAGPAPGPSPSRSSQMRSSVSFVLTPTALAKARWSPKIYPQFGFPAVNPARRQVLAALDARLEFLIRLEVPASVFINGEYVCSIIQKLILSR